MAFRLFVMFIRSYSKVNVIHTTCVSNVWPTCITIEECRYLQINTIPATV